MRLTRYFLPTLKETPSEAQIISHRLMLRAGMIRQTSAGIYAWLPLGLRVLRKIEAIVRQEQNRAGAIELLMPTLQSADLWIESGRYEDYGKEMLRIKDRHDRDLLYGPTNEEMITDLIRQSVKSYRALPMILYHIQWKFRDEVRPRFGVMRGREFLMKDGYSFDLDEASARVSYQKMFLSYLRTFAAMGLKAIPMRADTGPIGGDLSHEFIILAETGESAVFCDRDWLDLDILQSELADGDNLAPFIAYATNLYAATEEKHDAATCPVVPERLVEARGIEVGHIFYFGTKYSEPMGAAVATESGEMVKLHCGSYGIGVSRLVGAIIEANHDEAGIIWPKQVAPYHVALINLKTGDATCDQAAEALYHAMLNNGVDVLYDDRDERVGVKLAEADLLGLPMQILIGPKSVARGIAEVKNRADNSRTEIELEKVIVHLLHWINA